MKNRVEIYHPEELAVVEMLQEQINILTATMSSMANGIDAINENYNARLELAIKMIQAVDKKVDTLIAAYMVRYGIETTETEET